jgi:hypothetical protein
MALSKIKKNSVDFVDGTFTDIFIEGSSANTDWTGSGPYVANVAVVGLSVNDVPFIDLDLSDVAFANVAEVQTAWSSVYRITTADDVLTLFATEEPSSNLTITAKVL